MPILYDAGTSIINEGTHEIERYVVKITKLAGIDGDEFIKTFPIWDNRKNYTVLSKMKDELPPIKKNAFIGIGFNAYRYHNYIQFYSTFKSFPLSINDSITLHFENNRVFELEFFYDKKRSGYLTTNLFPINDQDLLFMSENKLLHWVIKNKEKNIALIGGFLQEENNKQYKSEKVGQGLFKKMAKQIFYAKSELISYHK